MEILEVLTGVGADIATIGAGFAAAIIGVARWRKSRKRPPDHKGE